MAFKQGVLLVNLGTPAHATSAAIKQYLGEFLTDRHVVDINRLIWLPILYGIVIPKRLKYIIKHYQTIWLNNQSPLLFYSQQLCQKLASTYPKLDCRLAMTYGEPNLELTLDQMKHYSHIDVISLYPQYSTTTTLAVIDKIKAISQSWSSKPQFNFVRDYADHPAYISALVKHIDHHLCIDQPDTLLLSYHGIPIQYISKRQDDYVDRCLLTSKLLKEALVKIYPNLNVMHCYQSRFGHGKWTEPNTSDVLIKLAQQGKSVAVICPGFAVDCIETLHEIDIENRQLYFEHGGSQFNYIEALNANHYHVEILKSLINRHENK